MKWSRSARGFTLVEALVALSIFVIILGAVITLGQVNARGLLMAKERIATARLMEMAMARIKSMPFWDLHPVVVTDVDGNFVRTSPIDSALPNFGFQEGATFTRPVQGQGLQVFQEYPSRHILSEFLEEIQKRGFDRFQIDFTFWRRALSGGTPFDLVRCTFDAQGRDTGSGMDAPIRFWDQNTDGDFYDVFESTEAWPQIGNLMTEVPSTNIREIHLRLWKDGVFVSSQSAMISLGQLTGQEAVSAERLLQLHISTPSPIVYEFVTTTQQLANDLSDYPTWYRRPTMADGTVGIHVSGVTKPGARVDLTRANNPEEVESAHADGAGLFSFNSTALWTALGTNQGQKSFVAVASTGALLSPHRLVSFIYDTQVPTITDETPTGPVANRTPLVGAILRDQGADNSGICDACTILQFWPDGDPDQQDIEREFIFEPASGRLRLVENRTTGKLLELAPGIYNVAVVTSDLAGFKATTSWSFTVTQETTDASQPVIGDCYAVSSVEIRVHITDPDSGVNPGSLVMTIGGSDVVSDTIGNAWRSWDPWANELVYVRPTAFSFPIPADQIVVRASNWGGEDNVQMEAEKFCPAVAAP